MGNGEWECRMEIRMSISCCTWLAQFFWTKEKLPRLWLLLLFLLLFLCCCCGALNAENPCCINNVRIMVQEAVQLHKYACAAIKKLLSVPGPEREEKKDRSPKHCSHLGNCCWRCYHCCCCCCYTYYPGQVTNLVSNGTRGSFKRLSTSPLSPVLLLCPSVCLSVCQLVSDHITRLQLFGFGPHCQLRHQQQQQQHQQQPSPPPAAIYGCVCAALLFWWYPALKEE